MGNYLALAAIIAAIAATYIQYRQIKDVSVPAVPWGQFIIWLAGLASGIAAFMMGIHLLVIVPLSLAVVAFLFFFLIVFTSRLPAIQPAVEVGSKFIDFTTLDSDGKPFTLSSLEGRPILLKFFRGHWCQYCYNELSAYNKFYDQYAELGIEMVVLSADTPTEARKMKEKLKIQAIVLSDENLEIIDKYRVRHEKAVTGARKLVRPIAIPASILISPDGLIRWIDVSENNRVRLDPLTVLVKSKTLLKHCEDTNKTRLVRSARDNVKSGDYNKNGAEHGNN
jgi:peroxiredoxin